MKGFKP